MLSAIRAARIKVTVTDAVHTADLSSGTLTSGGEQQQLNKRPIFTRLINLPNLILVQKSCSRS